MGNRVLIRNMVNSLQFDGATTVITKASQTAYNLSTFSVALWIKSLPNTAGTSEVFAEGSSASNNPIYVLRGSPNAPKTKNLYLIVRDDSNVSIVNNSGFTLDVMDDVWHHVVLTDNAGLATLYVDGRMDPKTIPYVRGTLTLNRTGFGALVRASIVNYITKGSLMRDCRVFNKVLTKAEVAKLYYSNIVPSGLVLEYLLDQTSGTSVNDTSGGGNNATITGAIWSTDTPMKSRTLVT